MSKEKQPRKDHAENLRFQLERNQQLQRRWESEFDQASQWLLRNWQTARLRQTHADLLQNPRYCPAVEFFLHELYGDRDFSRRDHDIERAYPIIVRTMPAGALHSVVMAIELNVLSHELDADLLRVLIDEFAITDQISEDTYLRAYRHCDNYEQRLRQINLIGILGQDLELIVAKPLIYTALRVAKGPAHLAGFGQLQQFIETGFNAFRKMGKADTFLEAITQRELKILERIYNQHPHPLDLTKD
ncbi:MAG: hypothetical protein V2J55_03740 [Candidatus Competibacteraceae bacterium]|jgi:hypothetical protein|nr:hypothetical protein [Candidatus Competibacteraceae bacterium]